MLLQQRSETRALSEIGFTEEKGRRYLKAEIGQCEIHSV